MGTRREGDVKDIPRFLVELLILWMDHLNRRKTPRMGRFRMKIKSHVKFDVSELFE